MPLFCCPALLWAADIPLTEGMARTIPGNQRTPARMDPVELDLLRGQAFEGSAWTAVKAAANGTFSGPFTSSGYLRFTVNSPADKTMFLEAIGNSMVYVNGVPHGGDIYMFGYVSVPVPLVKGPNELVFALGRGQFQGRLVDVVKPLSLDPRDSTTPDVVEGGPKSSLAALIVRNATADVVDDLVIVAGKHRTKVGRVLPMTTVKAGVAIPLEATGKVNVRLMRGSRELDATELTLRVRKPSQPHKITFRSRIDGSVQYYAVQPSTNPAPGQALFLSLHGASVEASGQAEAYSAKSWGTVVCPTNRRPYGFNWEDQGRLDALEVLELAQARYKPDPRQIYLTGHSMGGHGTWQLGAHFPDQWAAIAPAAGWVSYWSYAGGATYNNPSEIEKSLLAAMSPSDTLGLKSNFAQHGVFILHGDADETVPVSEAKTMADVLGKFHKSWDMALVPGAGHWWDNDPEAGADAVDDARLFRFFARHRRPLANEVTEVDFATADPGVSDSCHWVTVSQQAAVRQVSRVELVARPHMGQISGQTTNVSAMRIRPDALVLQANISLDIDGTKLTVPWAKEIALRNDGRGWTLDNTKDEPRFKHGFKAMFDREFAFVIDRPERDPKAKEHLQIARYLGEQWRVIANGRAEVLFRDELTSEIRRKRNLIYITNDRSLLPSGFGDNPVVLTRWLDGQQVGIIYGGTATTRLPYFTAGAHFADYFEFRPEMLRDGTKGIVRTGFWSPADEKK